MIFVEPIRFLEMLCYFLITVLELGRPKVDSCDVQMRKPRPREVS